jgi:hypothetical protein
VVGLPSKSTAGIKWLGMEMKTLFPKLQQQLLSIMSRVRAVPIEFFLWDENPIP